MSRGFVKEDDLEHAGTDLPERPVSVHTNYVTVSGLAALKLSMEQLAQLRTALNQQKEDAVATQKIAKIERDIRYYSSRLTSAVLVDNAAAHQDRVLFGATVTAEDEDGETHIFTIVGEDEADIHQHKVSWVSPLAKALIGHKVGETVIWQRPAGNLNLAITQIEYLISKMSS